jgi:chromosome partitioning protein
VRVIAIASQKGGVGKTTATINLAAALGRNGNRVIMVDLDPQASLTEYYGLQPDNLETTIYEVMDRGAFIQSALVEVAPGVKLIGTDISLSRAEVVFQGRIDRFNVLSNVLPQYAVEADYCLIDCPPSLGLLTMNGLGAADRVLIPVATELMAAQKLKLIMDTIDDVIKYRINPTLRPWYILPTMYSQQKINNRGVIEAIQAAYGEKVYPEAVKETVKYQAAAMERVDINKIDPELGHFWYKMAVRLNGGINW